VGKIAEKAVCGSIFGNIALYFECRINKNTLLRTAFFVDFAHWVLLLLPDSLLLHTHAHKYSILPVKHCFPSGDCNINPGETCPSKTSSTGATFKGKV